MSDKYVATYLNDHLAGSVMAVELLEHLEKAHAGTETARFTAALRADIEEDQRELVSLIERLKMTASVPRRAAAWLAEKMTELKLKVDDPAAGALRRLETFEAVAVGIEGKRALWLALSAASAGNPALKGPDYARLEARADEQRRRAETARLEAAREALRA